MATYKKNIILGSQPVNEIMINLLKTFPQVMVFVDFQPTLPWIGIILKN